MRWSIPLVVLGTSCASVDCDPAAAITAFVDRDGDGFGAGDAVEVCALDVGLVGNDDDCDDTDAFVSPFGDELCNGVDDDCDGRVDERYVEVPWYRDDDADGYGDPGALTKSCTQPEGYVRNLLDCDDSRDDANPDAIEVCNGLDDDCDAAVDDDDPSLELSGQTPWYADADADGFGDVAAETFACAAPTDSVDNADDCDDTRSDVNPDATEVCNGLDDDCDASVDIDDIDIDFSTTTVFYLDGDNDGLGDPDTSVIDCEAPPMHRTNGEDCDDSDPAVRSARNWLLDTDLDGVGAGVVVASQCDAPGPDHAPAVNGIDCNDSDATVFPGQTEICNGIDDDCDTRTDDDDPGLDLVTALPLFADLDGDGFGDPANPVLACDVGPLVSADALDCDDADAAVNPAAAEVCNDGVDDDCDSLADDDDLEVAPTSLLIWYLDGDDDGVGDLLVSAAACAAPPDYVAEPTDCDDSDPAVAAPALWFDDADGDGIGAGPLAGPSCTAPGPTYVANVGVEDCDDGDDTAYPGAPEVCADGIDQDCDGVDFCALFDDFESASLDPMNWVSLAGDAALTSAEAASGTQSINLAGGGGRLTSVGLDTSDCAGVSWSYEGQRGPEAPEPGEFLYLEWWDGSTWRTANAWEGNDFDDGAFSLRSGDIVDAGVAHPDFQVRWRSDGSGSGFDDFFVDDVLIDCL